MNDLVSELEAKVPNWQNFRLNYESTGKLIMLMRDEEVLRDRETEGCCLSPAALHLTAHVASPSVLFHSFLQFFKLIHAQNGKW